MHAVTADVHIRQRRRALWSCDNRPSGRPWTCPAASGVRQNPGAGLIGFAPPAQHKVSGPRESAKRRRFVPEDFEVIDVATVHEQQHADRVPSGISPVRLRDDAVRRGGSGELGVGI